MVLDEYSRKQLQDIISGTSITESQSTLHAARNILCSSFAINTTIKKDFEYQRDIKEKQKLELISFAKNFNLAKDIFVDENLYLTEGGEAKIYLGVAGYLTSASNSSLPASCREEFKG
jgi:hypothetical protein